MFHAPVILFAQQAKGEAAAAGAAIAGMGMLTFVCIIAFVVLMALVHLGLRIWFLIATYSALSACAQKNRDMEPGMVFLQLLPVPIFPLVWKFLIVFRTASSLEREYRKRGLRGDGDFGKTMGIWMLILPLTCIGLPAAPICELLYIFRVRAATDKLARSGRGSRDDDDDDDDDD